MRRQDLYCDSSHDISLFFISVEKILTYVRFELKMFLRQFSVFIKKEECNGIRTDIKGIFIKILSVYDYFLSETDSKTYCTGAGMNTDTGRKRTVKDIGLRKIAAEQSQPFFLLCCRKSGTGSPDMQF